MSLRYWIAAIALGLALAGPALGQSQQEAQGEQGRADAQEQPAQPLPIPLPVDVPAPLQVEIIEDKESADARERREAEARRHEKEDLVAQQGMNAATQAMNEATQRMASYALWSTIFVGVGTVLLIWTLLLTRAANKAAVAAVDATREIGEAQVRAYMQITEVWLCLEPGSDQHVDKRIRPVIKFMVKNYGQSPARWFRCNFLVRYYPPIGNLFQGSDGFPGKSWGQDIGVGEMSKHKSNVGSAPIPEESLSTLGKQGINVDVVIRYCFQDVFGKTIEDERVFIAPIPQNGIGREVRMLPHPLTRDQIQGMTESFPAAYIDEKKTS